MSRQTQTSLIPLNKLKIHCSSPPRARSPESQRQEGRASWEHQPPHRPPPHPATGQGELLPWHLDPPKSGNQVLLPQPSPQADWELGGIAGCRFKSFQQKEAAGANFLILFLHLFSKMKNIEHKLIFAL